MTATARQRIGTEGEDIARRHLERAGLAFLAANVRYRVGELDLVMQDTDGTVTFVEVRRRTRATYGGAAGSITRFKCNRVIAAASCFLAAYRLDTRPCRFDVVTIEGGGSCKSEDPHIAWLRDAFRPES